MCVWAKIVEYDPDVQILLYNNPKKNMYHIFVSVSVFFFGILNYNILDAEYIYTDI